MIYMYLYPSSFNACGRWQLEAAVRRNESYSTGYVSRSRMTSVIIYPLASLLSSSYPTESENVGPDPLDVLAGVGRY